MTRESESMVPYCGNSQIHTYVLSLGSNKSEDNVRAAIQWLHTQFAGMKVSCIYETPAVRADGVYHNAVAEVECGLAYAELESAFKTYEFLCGRDAEARAAGIVPIDIDIVITDGEVTRPWDYRQQFFKIGYSAIHDQTSAAIEFYGIGS